MSEGLTVHMTKVKLVCCGSVMMVPSFMDVKWREDGRKFYCPICRGELSYGTSRVAQLEKEKKRLEEERDRARRSAEFERNSRIAVQGHLTRAKKRAANGVCACCKRAFSNVEKHMKTKHPEFVKAAEHG